MKNTSKTKKQLEKNLANCQDKINLLEKEALESKKRELAFQDSEKKYRVLVESANFPIFTINKKGIFLFLNEEAAKTFMGKPEELVGKSIFDLFPQEVAKGFSKNIKKVFQTEKPYFLESRLVVRNKEFWTSVNLSPVKDSSGRVTAVIGVTCDISEKKKFDKQLQKSHDELGKRVNNRTEELILMNESLQAEIVERKQAEEALRESEEKYRSLTENINVGIYRNTPGVKGKFLEANPAIIKMFGYDSKEDFLKIHVSDLFKNPEERAKSDQKIKRDGFVKNEELRLIKKDGTIFWGSCTAKVIHDENGNILYYDGIIEDISERKQAEDKLKKAQEQYRDLVEKADIAFVIDTVEGRFEYFNKKFLDIFNYSEEEIKKESIQSLVHPDDLELVMKYHNLRIQGKKSPTRYEFRAISKNGTTVYLEVDSIPIKKNGNIIGTRSYIWDLTNRKKAEKSLKESQIKYHAVVENSKDGIAIIQEGRVTFVNSATAELIGYSPEELIGPNFIRFIAPAYKEMVKKRYRDHLAGKEVSNIYEIALLRKDGPEILVEINVNRIEIDKKPADLVFIKDITERKKAAEEIDKRQKYLESVLYSTPDAMITLNPKHHVVEWNPGAEWMFGYTRDEAIGKNLDNLITRPETMKEAKILTKEVLSGKKILPREAVRYRKDGTPIKVIVSGSPILIGKKLIGILAVYTDISEFKKTEEALKESEVRYSAVVENSKDGIVIIQDGKLSFVNPAAAQLLGYSLEVMMGSDFEKFVAPADREMAVKRYRDRRAGKKIPNIYELTLLRKDRTELAVEINVTLMEIDKKISNLIFVRDITDRKKAEEALRESEERFRLAANISTDLIYEWDVRTDELLWYGGIDKALGYPGNTIPRTITGWINLIHPEDLQKVEDSVTKHRTSTEPIFEEYRVHHKDGTWRHWVDKGTPVLDDKSLPTKWIGSCVDTTEAKRAEQALKESEQNYRNLIETSNDGIYLLYNRKFKIVNKKFQQMMNITQEELNKPDFDVMNMVAPKSRPLIEERLKKSARGEKQELTYEFTALTKDKKEIEIETTVSYVKYKEGIATLGIFRDISERKRMEALIEQINQLKEKLLSPISLNEKLRLITDGIVEIFDADFARIWLINPGDRCDSDCFHTQKKKGPYICRFKQQCLHLKVSSGRYTHTNGKIHKRVPFNSYKIGCIASGKDSRFLSNNVQKDKHIHDHAWAKKLGLVSFAGYRLLSGNEDPIGVLALFSKHKISPAIDDLIQGIANTTTQVIQNSIAEESLRVSDQRFSSIFNSAGDGILYLNKKGTVLEVNPSLLRLTGISRDEFIGKNAQNLVRKFLKPKDAGTLLIKLKNAFKGHAIKPYELEFRDKIFEISAPILKNSPGITGIVHDVTENKLALGKIQRSLEEKEILLQEIHHRVKNNLMIIIGLLNYYSINIDDENINKIINNLQNTIHSMALIHEKLYQQEDIAKINFVFYVKDLTNHLLGIHSQYMGQVTFQIKIDNIFLNLRTAIPCGMIISELVSNALKHAFPKRIPEKGKRTENQKYTIQVTIHKGKMLKNGKINPSPKGWYHLKVCDNGIGLPKNFKLKGFQTLGLRLVDLMVEQLEGQIRIERDKRTCFFINFKEQ